MGWDHMGFWGDLGTGGVWMWVGHLLWWALIVAGIVVLLRWTLARGPRRRNEDAPDHALHTLRERFARGEIDAEEFDARRRVLGG